MGIGGPTMVAAVASELRLDIRYGKLYVFLGFIRFLLMVCVKMTFFEIVIVLGNAPGFNGCLRARAESKGRAGWRRKRLGTVHTSMVRGS
jgi:hypothetical protein